MSGRISGLVWELDIPPQEKYVLQAYADHADHLGQNVKPGIPLISWKTGYKARNVQKIIESLKGKNILIPVKHQKGGRGIVTEYRIEFPPHLMRVTPVKGASEYTLSEKDALEDTLLTVKGVPECTVSEKRVHSSAQKGALDNIVNARAEPSGTKEKNIKGNRKRKSAQPSVETLLPHDFTLTPPMRAWFAENIDPTLVNIDKATEKWADSMRAKQKTYVDWHATWRNGMRFAEEWASARHPQHIPNGSPPAHCPPHKVRRNFSDDWICLYCRKTFSESQYQQMFAHNDVLM